MLSERIQQIVTYFHNVTLNAIGTKRTLFEYLEKGEVGRAVSLMVDNDVEVDNALKEYNPENHDVNRRPNKYVEGDFPYITEKLPRSREQYINETELFFLFGEPVIWKKTDGDDKAYSLYTKFLDNIFFNAKIRQCKRLAGAETECALVYNFSRRNGKLDVDAFIAARSLGYQIRTMFDQYGNMQALAYGYRLNENGIARMHWDILTAETNYYCSQKFFGWEVDARANPTGKINGIYFHQQKAWAGAEKRMRRDEELDSKVADNNNYFADPMAEATADVIASLPRRDKPGKLIQLTGKESRFNYITPPSDSAARRDEQVRLNDSILFDTLTPDLSFEKMKGLGSLSGVAIRNSLILGYIKRANRMDVYEELLTRFKHLTLAVLCEIYPDKRAQLEKLEIDFEFSDPFPDDKRELWKTIGSLYSQGVCSLDTAVKILSLTDAPEEEIQRLKDAKVAKTDKGEASTETQEKK